MAVLQNGRILQSGAGNDWVSYHIADAVGALSLSPTSMDVQHSDMSDIATWGWTNTPAVSTVYQTAVTAPAGGASSVGRIMARPTGKKFYQAIQFICTGTPGASEFINLGLRKADVSNAYMMLGYDQGFNATKLRCITHDGTSFTETASTISLSSTTIHTMRGYWDGTNAKFSADGESWITQATPRIPNQLLSSYMRVHTNLESSTHVLNMLFICEV